MKTWLQLSSFANMVSTGFECQHFIFLCEKSREDLSFYFPDGKGRERKS